MCDSLERDGVSILNAKVYAVCYLYNEMPSKPEYAILEAMCVGTTMGSGCGLSLLLIDQDAVEALPLPLWRDFNGNIIYNDVFIEEEKARLYLEQLQNGII